MKDKRVLIGIVALIILLLAGGAYFVMSRNAASTDEDQFGSVEEELPSLSSEEVGLEMEALRGNQQVVFSLTKTDGITAVEYELTYFAEDGQQRAVIGSIDKADIGDSVQSKPLDLGSCSSGVCKYDKGVKEVDLLLKVTKDGKDYQVKDQLSLK